jgi:hypothetical protein
LITEKDQLRTVTGDKVFEIVGIEKIDGSSKMLRIFLAEAET